jgi:peptide-methionine (R)-S-oxide reductase
MALDRRAFLALTGAGAAGAVAFAWGGGSAPAAAETFQVNLTDTEWRKRLTPAQYATLRHAVTERPESSPLDHEHRKGTYFCAGCGLALYSSATKFDSGTGWPSFWKPLPNAIRTKTDHALIDARTEVHCRRCGGHLGHVFDDGPPPTHLRYCMNGVALRFVPA